MGALRPQALGTALPRNRQGRQEQTSPRSAQASRTKIAKP
mgnify:CR=1 FL=1